MFLAAALAVETHNPSEASLVSAYRAVRPGESFDVALRVKMEPGWHIYWENPGESGYSPTLTWKLPAGWKAGPIRWPTPERVDVGGVVTYSYLGEALLLVRLIAPKSAATGTKSLQVTAKWLVCREGCLPAKADLRLPIRVARQDVADPQWSARLAEADRRLPRASSTVDLTAWRDGNKIELTMKGAGLPEKTEFFPADTAIEPSAPQIATQEGEKHLLQLTVSSYAPAKIERLRGLLVAPKGATLQPGLDAITVDIPLLRRKP
jgi:thiol:disulfide interchange protein DsbD